MGVVLELLECGADPNQADKVRGIHSTIDYFIGVLVCRCYCLDLQDGWTAVYWASNNGHDEIVRVLLAAKATVNTQTKVGFVVQTHISNRIRTVSSYHSCCETINTDKSHAEVAAQDYKVATLHAFFSSSKTRL